MRLQYDLRNDKRADNPTEIRLMRCLHEAVVAAIGRATDRRDDRLV